MSEVCPLAQCASLSLCCTARRCLHLARQAAAIEGVEAAAPGGTVPAVEDYAAIRAAMREG